MLTKKYLRVASLATVLTFVFFGANAHNNAIPEMDEVDRFAQKVFQNAQLLSFRDKIEYCGFIGYDHQRSLVATTPNAGDADGCEPIDDGELDVIASYHTHGSYSADADTETPSVDDLVADFSEGIDGYVATPGGRFWVISLEDQATFLLCEKGCVQKIRNLSLALPLPQNTPIPWKN